MHGDAPTTQDFIFDAELFNRAYIPLLNNYSEFLHLWGSAGSGKSRFTAQREIIESFEWSRRRRKTIVARKVATTLKDSCYAELKAVIYEWGLEDCFEILKSPLSITNLKTGVEFLFRGFDDVEKIKSITGADRAWYEETTEADTQNEVKQLRTRLRGFDRVQVTLTYNPIDEHHWLNTQLHQEKPKGHEFFHSTYKDNEQMLAKDPHYANFIESTKDSDPNYYRVYGLGLWGQVVEGLIYPKCETGVLFPEKDGEDDIHSYGLDFGFSDPTALVALHVQDALPKKNLIAKEILYEPGLDGPGLVSRFNDLGVRRDICIIADSARPEMIYSLQDAGYLISSCEKGAGSVLSGINKVRKYNLQIAAGSKNLVKEVHGYQKRQMQGIWIEEPATNQVDHGMDAIRYGEQGAGVGPGIWL